MFYECVEMYKTDKDKINRETLIRPRLCFSQRLTHGFDDYNLYSTEIQWLTFRTNYKASIDIKNI